MSDDLDELTKAEQRGYANAMEAERKLHEDRIEQLERERDGAYLERNQLVALLASVYPSGIKRTAIEGWHEDWHGCIYIDFPWGQASWHYHESQADLFSHLPPYEGQWDGHSTEAKYTAIVEASRAVLAELEGMPT